VVLRIGQKIPDFSLYDSEGNDRKLSELIQRGVLTIVFFPFAFSGVCDRQICLFRDNLIGGGLNGSVVGISSDSVYTLKIFAETYNPGFPLLSDFNRKVSRAFDILQDSWSDFGYKGVAKRAVFVIDRREVLRYRWIDDDVGKEPPYEEISSVARRLS